MNFPPPVTSGSATRHSPEEYGPPWCALPSRLEARTDWDPRRVSSPRRVPQHEGK